MISRRRPDIALQTLDPRVRRRLFVDVVRAELRVGMHAALVQVHAFGFLLGLPALRLSGPYLAIATLGFGLAVIQIIGHGALFGGHMGLVVPTARAPFAWKIRALAASHALGSTRISSAR